MFRCCSLLAIALYAIALSTLCACGGASTTMAPNLSPHFEEVAGHLHLGGEVYVYADVDGDLRQLTESVNELLAQIEPEGEITPDQIRQLLNATGFANLQAFGLSSYEDGAIFRNRAYLKFDGRREGLMTVAGGSPHPFEVVSLAPAGSDLVIEQDLYLKQGYGVLIETLAAFEPQMAKEIERELAQSLPGLAVTGKDILKAADTKLMLIAKLDPNRRIDIRDISPAVSLPHVDFAMALDGYGFVVDQAADQYGQAGLFDVSRDKDTLVLQLNIPAPPALQGYKPVLARKGARLWLASTRAFLDATLGGEAKLSSESRWSSASEGLAKEGNGVSYVSPEFFGVVRSIAKQLPSDEERAFGEAFIDYFLPEGDQAIASVQVNGTDSFYFASNSTFSHKSTLGMLMYVNPLTLGVLSAVAIPAFAGVGGEPFDLDTVQPPVPAPVPAPLPTPPVNPQPQTP